MDTPRINSRHRFFLGIGIALVGASLWGFSGSCAQQVLSSYEISPLFITAIRTIIAALILGTFSWIKYRDTLREILSCNPMRLRLLLFAFGLFLSQLTFAISVHHTNAGTATVLQSLATVFVMIATCVTARRIPRILEFVGLLCAVASTYLIATQGVPGAMSLPLSGLIWGIINALSVSLYIVIPRPLYNRWPSIPVISCAMALTAVMATLAWGSECAIQFFGQPVCAPLSEVIFPTLDATGWLVLIGGISILGTALAFGFYLSGVSIVGSVNGILLGAAEPASAMVITTLWLGTAFSGADWIGLGLMLAMIALVSLTPTKNS